MGGISRGRQVLVGGGEQIVQGKLVAAAQGAAEAGKGLLFLAGKPE